MAVVDGLRVVLCRPGDFARMWLLTSILCPTSSSRLLSSHSITSMLCCFSRVIKKREPFFRRARVRRGWRWEVSLLAPSRSVVCGAQGKEERRGEVKLVGFRHACLSQTTLSWPANGAKSGGHVRVDMALSKSSLKDNGPKVWTSTPTTYLPLGLDGQRSLEANPRMCWTCQAGSRSST